MKQPLFKHITAILFLVAFLAPRIADVHALDHLSEEDELLSCELCDITSNSQEFDLFLDLASQEDFKIMNKPSSFIVNSQYDCPLEKIVSPTSVYNKPPPSLIVG